MTQWLKKIGGIIGDSENRRNWEKWKRRTSAFNTLILFLGKSKTKRSRRWKASNVYDWPCRGYWSCIQGMTIPSYLSLEMHLQKIPDQTKVQRWMVIFWAEVCAKARNKREGVNFSYTEWKTGECFQQKTIGFYSHGDMCNYLPTHGMGRRETVWTEVGDAKKISLGTSILSSTESERTDWREKLKQSESQSCDFR